MSISDYLASLNIGQLIHARSCCDELICRRQAAAMKQCWAVSDRDLNWRWFQEHEFVAAAEWLAKYAAAIERKGEAEDLLLTQHRLQEDEWQKLFGDDYKGGGV
ncbi:hypothetical protein [Thauera sinica]|uniref:Uncharacterized protein n=1 Tax=Thauera sinica TaxID=2665146 RepID=A0ABW1AR72_9RHOO|nr:hypothetical protein [Thauera sp. K11]